MKKIFLLAAALFITTGVFAQKYAFINTELIFKAIPQYNSAIEELDKLTQTYRDQIDAQYDKISEMYDRYQFQKSNLSETARQRVEDNIITLEQELEVAQEEYFGMEGRVMKRRIELLRPIQERVFTAIDNIAKSGDYDMIIDIANSASIVYYNQTLDITQDILKSLGIQ
ncbi:MAG: OmpH family outer membrane protein [Rikenellaceae bacterium]|nr:OmpH family outer membrane protein [Rikenellaceae bacterium]